MRSIDYAKTFSSRLKETIERKNWDITELCSDTGITEDRLNELLSGNVLPEIDEFFSISVFLDVSSDYLSGLSDEYKMLSSKAISDDFEFDSQESENHVRKAIALFLACDDEGQQRFIDILGKDIANKE